MSAMKDLTAPLVAEAFYIVDVRKEWRWKPYVTVWRPNDAGYAWPLSWAGQYTRERIEQNPGYYYKQRYECVRALDRYPVPCSVVDSLAVDPRPGEISDDAGPVLPNTTAVRAALRRARYVPASVQAILRAEGER